MSRVDRVRQLLVDDAELRALVPQWNEFPVDLLRERLARFAYDWDAFVEDVRMCEILADKKHDIEPVNRKNRKAWARVTTRFQVRWKNGEQSTRLVGRRIGEAGELEKDDRWVRA